MTPQELVNKYPNLDLQVANDWLQVRKSKRLPLTHTALKAIEREAGKANMTIEQAIERCAEESWAGFKASWVNNVTKNNNNKRPTLVYDNDWLKTQQGIDQKAKELGVNISKCANYKEATDLIFTKIRSFKNG